MNIYGHISNPQSFPNEKDAPSLYNVLFHYSHYRGMWACFNRDEKSQYFNGKTNIIGYGDSPDKAFEEYLNQNEDDE